MSTTNRITRSSLVLFSPDQMFDLVNDIEAYPSFLPWCRSSTIINKTDEVISASLELAKGGIHHVFSTRNTLIQGEAIDIELIDGPFEYLEGHWQFQMIGNNQGCRIQLDMDFAFSNRLIGLALSPIFTQISGSLVDAFCKRAQEIYGND
ncbi:MAG: type II toxin-antitoxin system RatA family toxin [Piscirickettsiaceae bacterium]|nr:type II toxin-antitoxin system RatA family toxin [Piscirickettsiaceae bacterium]